MSGMFGSLTRKGRFSQALNEIRQTLAAVPLRFSTDVLDEYDRMNKGLGFDTRAPTFERISITHQSSGSRSQVSQWALAIEGLCFFTHYINRLAFRAEKDVVREQLDEPILAVARMYAEMLTKLLAEPTGSVEAPSSDAILAVINERDALYGGLPRLLGDSVSDKQSALGVAAATIAETADTTKVQYLEPIVQLALVEQIRAFKWKEMIERVASNLPT